MSVPEPTEPTSLIRTVITLTLPITILISLIGWIVTTTRSSDWNKERKVRRKKRRESKKDFRKLTKGDRMKDSILIWFDKVLIGFEYSFIVTTIVCAFRRITKKNRIGKRISYDYCDFCGEKIIEGMFHDTQSCLINKYSHVVIE